MKIAGAFVLYKKANKKGLANAKPDIERAFNAHRKPNEERNETFMRSEALAAVK